MTVRVTWLVLLCTLVASDENVGDTRVWTYARPKRSEDYQFYSSGFRTEDKFYTLPPDSPPTSAGRHSETRYASSSYKFGHLGSDVTQSVEVEPEEAPKVIPHTDGELPVRVVVHHHFHPSILAENVQHPTNSDDVAKLEGFEQNQDPEVANGHYEELQPETIEVPVKVEEQNPEIVRKLVHHHFHAPILAEDVQHPVDPSDEKKLAQFKSEPLIEQIDENSGQYPTHAVETKPTIPEKNEILRDVVDGEPHQAPPPPPQPQPVIQLVQPYAHPQPIYPAPNGGIYMAIPNMHFSNLYRLSFPTQLVPVQFNTLQG